jgi:UDP-N-acetylmuramate: L-alanyl-gamma-D-glutamyl-meso-diaminopimelate ligase
MRVHLIGVSGTGMGALAMLFCAQGHEVSGSDASFDPPMGPELERAGVRCLRGYSAANLEPAPDLVVVGNAIRRDNPEATAVRERGLWQTSMSGALREQFLPGRRALVCAGTHGKTTTSTMCAVLLSRADLEPGWFIGGLPKDLPSGAALGSTKRRLTGQAPGARAPFVLEGDEYDAVYWDKKPKFFDYVGTANDDVIIVTSCELDHVDIYPTREAYEAQFAELFRRVSEGGTFVCDARDATLRRLAREAKARVVWYGLDGDETGDVTPTWLGAPCGMDDGGMQPFDLFVGGASCGRFAMHVPGAHNVRNAVGAIAACAEGFGVGMAAARAGLAQFHGVRRRQDLLGTPGGVFVYDDFAHHPTAVDETLKALRARHRTGALWAVFEPRSATACRSLHQDDYTRAFGAADRVIFAPLGRSNIPEAERLDVARLARELGEKAAAADSADSIVETLARETKPGDVVALLSNGAFAGIHARVLSALAK